MNSIPETIFDAEISGLNLTGATLAEQIGKSDQTLLVFLRHFG